MSFESGMNKPAAQKPAEEVLQENEAAAQQDSLAPEVMQNLVSLTIDSRTSNSLIKQALEKDGVKDPAKNPNALYQDTVAYGKAEREKVGTLRRENISQIVGRSPEEQAALAQEYFKATTGNPENLGSSRITMDTYEIFRSMSGTPFAEEFKRLERERLTKAGFGSSDGWKGTALE